MEIGHANIGALENYLPGAMQSKPLPWSTPAVRGYGPNRSGLYWVYTPDDNWFISPTFYTWEIASDMESDGGHGPRLTPEQLAELLRKHPLPKTAVDSQPPLEVASTEGTDGVPAVPVRPKITKVGRCWLDKDGKRWWAEDWKMKDCAMVGCVMMIGDLFNGYTYAELARECVLKNSKPGDQWKNSSSFICTFVSGNALGHFDYRGFSGRDDICTTYDYYWDNTNGSRRVAVPEAVVQPTDKAVLTEIEQRLLTIWDNDSDAARMTNRLVGEVRKLREERDAAAAKLTAYKQVHTTWECLRCHASFTSRAEALDHDDKCLLHPMAKRVAELEAELTANAAQRARAERIEKAARKLNDVVKKQLITGNCEECRILDDALAEAGYDVKGPS